MIISRAQVTEIFDFDHDHVQIEGTFTSPYDVEGGQIFFYQIDPSQFLQAPGEQHEFRHVLKKPVNLQERRLATNANFRTGRTSDAFRQNYLRGAGFFL
jgi:hypothetical protein